MCKIARKVVNVVHEHVILFRIQYFKQCSRRVETVLHSFSSGTDGAVPLSGVIRDPVGNLFGTTYVGGTGTEGIVFELKPIR